MSFACYWIFFINSVGSSCQAMTNQSEFMLRLASIFSLYMLPNQLFTNFCLTFNNRAAVSWLIGAAYGM